MGILPVSPCGAGRTCGFILLCSESAFTARRRAQAYRVAAKYARHNICMLSILLACMEQLTHQATRLSGMTVIFATMLLCECVRVCECECECVCVCVCVCVCDFE